jgi:hypothetical protein
MLNIANMSGFALSKNLSKRFVQETYTGAIEL